MRPILPLALMSCFVLSDVNLWSDDVTAPGAQLELAADGFGFTEGPAADAEGNVYFTDQPNDRIFKYDTNGELTTFLTQAGRSNGLYFGPDGVLYACADEQNQLWRIAADGSHEVLVDSFEGKRLNGPNDLWIHPDGTIFFTDPFYKRNYWQHEASEQDGQCVYRLSADRKDLIRVAEHLVQPNGIIGDAARGVLYVADIGDKKTYVYSITDDRRLENRALFCAQGSDGMTLDARGNLYLTGRPGVSVFNPQGKLQQVISVPERWTANVTFGGQDNKTLFITASDSLYTIKMKYPGK